jgi:hypothetical protein
MYEIKENPLPVVGEFATFGIGADAYPVEIIAVTASLKTITTRGVNVTHDPGYAVWSADSGIPGAEVHCTPKPNGIIRKFTLRKNAVYRPVGANYGYLATGYVADRRDSSF